MGSDKKNVMYNFLSLTPFVQFYDDLGDVICHGDASIIKEGHKSFPSGHTSCKQLWHRLGYCLRCLVNEENGHHI